MWGFFQQPCNCWNYVSCFSPFLDECFRQSPFNSGSKSSSPAEASSSARAAFHGKWGKKHRNMSVVKKRNITYTLTCTLQAIDVFCLCCVFQSCCVQSNNQFSLSTENESATIMIIVLITFQAKVPSIFFGSSF